MATSPSSAPTPGAGFLGGLARRLVADGVLAEEKAKEAQAKAQKAGISIVSQLVDDKLAAPAKIAHSASTAFGVPKDEFADTGNVPSFTYDAGDGLGGWHATSALRAGRA